MFKDMNKKAEKVVLVFVIFCMFVCFSQKQVVMASIAYKTLANTISSNIVLANTISVNKVSVHTASTDMDIESQTEKIVKKKTKSSDSEKKKLKKLFKYVENNYDYKRTTGFETYDGWAGDYAVEMYSEKKGSCYHFAAAYSFLAQKATGYNVRIGVGKTNGFSGELQSHAWTEIKINSKWYICDTNMDKYAENSSGKYFLKKRNSLKKVYDNYKDVQYFKVEF